jgi:hypothetical protein
MYESAFVSKELLTNLIKAMFDEQCGGDAFAVSALFHTAQELKKGNIPDVSKRNNILHEMLKSQLRRNERDLQQTLQGVMNRIRKLKESDTMWRMLDHVPEWDEETGTYANHADVLDMYEAVESNKVYLIDMGDLERQSAKQVELLVMDQLHTILKAKKKRGDMQEWSDDHIVNFIVDEAKEILQTPLVKEEILPEGRSFNIGCEFLIQYPKQAEDGFTGDDTAYEEILNNVHTKLIGEVDGVDTRFAESLFHEDHEPDEIKERIRALAQGEWLAQLPSPKFRGEKAEVLSMNPLGLPAGHPEAHDDIDMEQYEHQSAQMQRQTRANHCIQRGDERGLTFDGVPIEMESVAEGIIDEDEYDDDTSDSEATERQSRAHPAEDKHSNNTEADDSDSESASDTPTAQATVSDSGVSFGGDSDIDPSDLPNSPDDDTSADTGPTATSTGEADGNNQSDTERPTIGETDDTDEFPDLPDDDEINDIDAVPDPEQQRSGQPAGTDQPTEADEDATSEPTTATDQPETAPSPGNESGNSLGSPDEKSTDSSDSPGDDLGEALPADAPKRTAQSDDTDETDVEGDHMPINTDAQNGVHGELSDDEQEYLKALIEIMNEDHPTISLVDAISWTRSPDGYDVDFDRLTNLGYVREQKFAYTKVMSPTSKAEQVTDTPVKLGHNEGDFNESMAHRIAVKLVEKEFSEEYVESDDSDTDLVHRYWNPNGRTQLDHDAMAAERTGEDSYRGRVIGEVLYTISNADYIERHWREVKNLPRTEVIFYVPNLEAARRIGDILADEGLAQKAKERHQSYEEISEAVFAEREGARFESIETLVKKRT